MAKVSRRNTKLAKLQQLQSIIDNNCMAMIDGPKKKSWTIHDMKILKPLTMTARDFFKDYMSNMNIVAYGTAGTGKTLSALYLAFNDIFNPKIPADKLIIVRSAVPSREVGFLPGDESAKHAPYEQPYKDSLKILFGKSSTYDDMKEAGLIQFETTSFLRGVTWPNAIIIMDEAQSMTFHELDTVMTRLGEGSRIMVLGDTKQNDLIYKKSDVSGFADFIRVAERMNDVSCLRFTKEDIVRSGFVRDWIIAKEELNL